MAADGWAGMAAQRRAVGVEDHSFFFTGPDVEQAIPYGIYDITRDSGWVNVGTDHRHLGFRGGVHPPLVAGAWPGRLPGRGPSADHRGRGRVNSCRYRVWKSELAALAAETGLVITVCHFPPGTSKWNKIEHRLF